MDKILTAEEFVTLVLAKLSLSLTRPDIILMDADLDRRFEEAYETLLENEKTFGVRSNFTFYRDPLHGNTAKLRDALLSLRERRLVGPTDEPRAVKVEIPAERAKALLRDAPIPDKFLGRLVQGSFGDLTAASGPA